MGYDLRAVSWRAIHVRIAGSDFEEREAHVRERGRFEAICFCAVQRPDDHPRRPAGYAPLDAFWNRRGFVRHPELRTTFSWRDLDEEAESPKPMVFWLKTL